MALRRYSTGCGLARPARSEQDDFPFPRARGAQGAGHPFGLSSARRGKRLSRGWEQVGGGQSAWEPPNFYPGSSQPEGAGATLRRLPTATADLQPSKPTLAPGDSMPRAGAKFGN